MVYLQSIKLLLCELTGGQRADHLHQYFSKIPSGEHLQMINKQDYVIVMAFKASEDMRESGKRSVY